MACSRGDEFCSSNFEVPRARTIWELASTSGSLHVVYGPKGCGKTTCARQFARTFATSYVLNRTEEFASEVEHLLADVASSATGGPHRDQSICVVLDDVDLADPACWDVAERCIRQSVVLVLVTEDISDAPDDVLTGVAFVGPEDLKMSIDEVGEVLRGCSSREVATEEIRRVHEATRGFPALVRIMHRAVHRERQGMSKPAAELEHWLRRLSMSVDEDVMHAYAVIGWLRRFCESDLERCDISADTVVVAASRLPLLCVAPSADGSSVRLDPLIADALCAVFDISRAIPQLQGTMSVLDQRQDWPQAARLLSASRAETSVVVRWLRSRGRDLLDSGCGSLARELVERIPATTLLSDCDLLLLAAEVARECGQYDECIARASAALTLSKHSRDRRIEREATLSAVRAYLHLGRHSDAAPLAESLLRDDVPGDGSTSSVLAALAVASVSLNSGCIDEAASLIERAYRASLASEADAPTRAKAANGMAAALATLQGDHSSAVRLLAPILERCDLMQADRWMLQGNVACGLMETGRIVRAERMFADVLSQVDVSTTPDVISAYLPFRGAAWAASGATEEAREAFERGIRQSVVLRDACSAAISRVYYSTFLRSCSMAEESLNEAEAAADFLGANNAMGHYAFAAVEVAASLLAVGDSAASTSWLCVARESRLWLCNSALRLRAAMVQAAIPRANPREAAEELLPHREHILSGNSNWQIAMYIRAFPELLGAFALAIEPAELPAHMLQMILPEHAERSLLATRGWLPAETWREVGVRLLGSEDFATFVERDGRPLCRVRLFGGLEVNVGGRIIRERDWKKRKARLLFAMLVTRHGNDVARDQVFDHLWPEMDEERAKNNLYVAWSAMKTALMGSEPGRCPYVESVGGVCRVISENVRSDVDEFDSAVAAADAARKAGDAVAELAAYRRISDAYRGDLLPGDVYDDWFAQLRGQYRVAFCDAMVHAAELSIDAEKPVEGAAYVRRAIQTDPLREDLYQMALRCQIASGQRSGAIETYQQCRTRLSEDLGLDPSVETRALYDRILAMEERPGGYARELLED